MSELNPHPTCWDDTGITPVEQAIMRRVAEQFPDGAYAAFVRKMDKGQLGKTTAKGLEQ